MPKYLIALIVYLHMIVSQNSNVINIGIYDIPYTVQSTALLVISFYPLDYECAECEWHKQQYQEIANKLSSEQSPVVFGISSAPKVKHPYLRFYAGGTPQEPGYLDPMDKSLVKNWIYNQVERYFSSLNVDGNSPPITMSAATSRNRPSPMSGAAVTVADNIMLLNKKNFQTALSNNNLVVVLFSSPSESNMKKMFKEIAHELNTKGSAAKAAEVDVTKDQQLLFTRTTATGNPPIIIFFKNGTQYKQFTGKKDKISIMNWIEMEAPTSRSTDEIIVVRSNEHFQKEKTHSEFLLLANYPTSYFKGLFPVFKKVVDGLKTTKGLGKITFMELIDSFEIEYSKEPLIDLTLFEKGEQIGSFELFVTPDEALEVQNTIKWVTETLGHKSSDSGNKGSVLQGQVIGAVPNEGKKLPPTNGNEPLYNNIIKEKESQNGGVTTNAIATPKSTGDISKFFEEVPAMTKYLPVPVLDGAAVAPASRVEIPIPKKRKGKARMSRKKPLKPNSRNSYED